MAIGKSQRISLDLNINRYVFVRVSQYDINSREIIIQITDNGAPYPINSTVFSARVECQKSDGNVVIDDIPSENILPDGTIKIILSEQMCTSPGNNEVKIILTKPLTKECIHTKRFSVIVDKGVTNNKQVTSSSEYRSFENSLVQLEHILLNLKPITKSQIDQLF